MNIENSNMFKFFLSDNRCRRNEVDLWCLLAVGVEVSGSGLPLGSDGPITPQVGGVTYPVAVSSDSSLGSEGRDGRTLSGSEGTMVLLAPPSDLKNTYE